MTTIWLLMTSHLFHCKGKIWFDCLCDMIAFVENIYSNGTCANRCTQIWQYEFCLAYTYDSLKNVHFEQPGYFNVYTCLSLRILTLIKHQNVLG